MWYIYCIIHVNVATHVQYVHMYVATYIYIHVQYRYIHT